MHDCVTLSWPFFLRKIIFQDFQFSWNFTSNCIESCSFTSTRIFGIYGSAVTHGPFWRTRNGRSGPTIQRIRISLDFRTGIIHICRECCYFILIVIFGIVGSGITHGPFWLTLNVDPCLIIKRIRMFSIFGRSGIKIIPR